MGFEIENGILKKYTEEIGVSEVVIPDSVTSIGEGAFYECKSLTSVIIPDSVTSIGDVAFSACSSLTSIIIPDSVTNIGTGAFTRTKWIENQQKENPFAIINGILIDCKDTVSVTLPDNTAIIGKYAFSCCISLKSVSIPDNLTSIEDNAFKYCENLKSLIFRNKEYYVAVYADFVKSDGNLRADTEIMFNFFNNKKYKNFAAIKKSEYKIPMALLWYFKYKNKIAKAYIKRNIKKVVSYLAENNNTALIYKVLPLGFITKKNIDAIIDIAAENAEIREIFLNYRHENFGF